MKRVLFAAFHFVLLLVCVFAQTSSTTANIGQLTYFEGSVSVTRRGVVYSGSGVDFGFAVQNLDQIRTGSNGLATVRLNSSGLNAEVRVAANTCYTIERTAVTSSSSGTSVELITGRIAFAVTSMTGGSQFTVRTQSAVMGVRGTDFECTTGIQGEILVECSTGRVECTDSVGNILFAEPGQVVEQDEAANFRRVPCAVSDLATFRNNWNTQRVEAFRGNALPAIRNFARRYNQLKQQFDQAFEELRRQQTIIDRWADEDRRGRPGTAAQQMRDRREIVGSLFQLRRVLFMMERVYFRLVELQSYHDQGVGRGNLEGSETTTAFFARFQREGAELDRRFAIVQHVMQMYAERNGGVFPTDSFGTGNTGASSDGSTGASTGGTSANGSSGNSARDLINGGR